MYDYKLISKVDLIMCLAEMIVKHTDIRECVEFCNTINGLSWNKLKRAIMMSMSNAETEEGFMNGLNEALKNEA